MSLKIENLSKRFGNEWVFRDVSFEIPSGMIFGLCGPTASGKSTLLKTIAGMSKPTTGAVFLDGDQISETSVKRAQVLLLDGVANAGFWHSLVGSRPTAKSQLEVFENTIVSSPKVLVFDEPFSLLDPQNKAACLDKIREWVQSGDRLVVFASNDFNQLASLADRIAILAKGIINQVGSPEEIYGNPESIDSALLSGETNLIFARRISSSNVLVPEFQTIVGEHRLFAGAIEKQRLGPINQNITLAIRPEQISMSMGASFPEDNLVKATVVKTTYCGATSLITFDANGLQLQARVFKVVGLGPGDDCMLSLPPERLIVLAN